MASNSSADNKNNSSTAPAKKVAVVTGGNRGIGEAVVRGLAADKNTHVVFTGKSRLFSLICTTELVFAFVQLARRRTARTR